jgi:hypothetical protein
MNMNDNLYLNENVTPFMLENVKRKVSGKYSDLNGMKHVVSSKY